MTESIAPRTVRGRAKAGRRQAMLDAAARLFAERGFNGVSIEDLGSATGVSGPAVYRHFPSKQAVLAALLVGVSEGLLDGGRGVVSRAPGPAEALLGLIRFHVDFALANSHVIRVQDRDLGGLTEADRHSVRALQRQYVELWVRVLQNTHPDVDAAVLRTRAHAVFGLMNSTPHTGRALPRTRLRDELERMAWASLA